MKKVLFLLLFFCQQLSFSMVCPMSWEAYDLTMGLKASDIDVGSRADCLEKAKPVKDIIAQIQEYSDTYFSDHAARLETGLFNKKYVAFFLYEFSDVRLHRYLGLPEEISFEDVGGIYRLGKREMWMPMDLPVDEFYGNFVHELTHAMDDRVYLRRHGFKGEMTKEFRTFYQVMYEARAIYRECFYKDASKGLPPDIEFCESQERLEGIYNSLEKYYFGGNEYFKQVWDFALSSDVLNEKEVIPLSELYDRYLYSQLYKRNFLFTL